MSTYFIKANFGVMYPEEYQGVQEIKDIPLVVEFGVPIRDIVDIEYAVKMEYASKRTFCKDAEKCEKWIIKHIAHVEINYICKL